MAVEMGTNIRRFISSIKEITSTPDTAEIHLRVQWTKARKNED